jgi:cyclopropane-fatty-acyl-phospholipid synthase
MNLLEQTIQAPPSLKCRGIRSPRAPSTARLLLALLETLPQGSLVLHLPDGTTRSFGNASTDRSSGGDASASVTLHDWRVLADTLRRGDTGFAEGYISGLWDTPDLVRLLGLLARNQRKLDRACYGVGLARWLLRLRHLLNANTRRQAKRNIVSHYDLGNAFYRLWLDETMTYSAGLFEGDPSRSLEHAQRAKYARLLDQLALPRGAHLLEVGCGWGGFAELAARRGYRVTALSLSDAQTAYARERLQRERLAERVEFRVEDYRDVTGTYDGIVSIEMFEAVGERWWPTYFRKLHALLRPGGRAAIQSITIDDERFERYRRETDFIQQHIFPGGMLASRPRLLEVARAGGFRLLDAYAFGGDYARTLTRWLASFEAHLPAVRSLGFDEPFVRCWRFYLAYCIAAFEAGSTDVGHYTFARA